jgi:hypothetical protein
MYTMIKISSCATAVSLIAGGCASPNLHQGNGSLVRGEQFVALTVMSTEPMREVPAGGFRLGAGDSLGQAVYENYVTIVRTNPKWQYASGE